MSYFNAAVSGKRAVFRCHFSLTPCVEISRLSVKHPEKAGVEFREAHPEIPWREMNDLRNVLIHAPLLAAVTGVLEAGGC